MGAIIARPLHLTCAINKVTHAGTSMPTIERGIPLDGYRRALRFIVPYWPRLVFVLLAGIAATGFGLLQPYISKLLIDDALLKHNLRMLLIVSGLMFGVTVLGFVLNILSSYQYVRVSASVLFDMRAGAVPASANALAALLGAQQTGRCGFAH